MKFTKKFKENLWLVIIGVVLFWGLSNYKLVISVLGFGIDILRPFIIGAVMAFILNVPMSGIEKRLYKEPKGKRAKKIAQSLKRPMAIAITLIIALGIITLLGWLIVPALAKTISKLTADLPVIANDLADKIKHNEQLTHWAQKMDFKPNKLISTVTHWLKNSANVLGTINSTVGVLSAVFSSVVNFILGIFFAVYMLAQKEKLKSQGQKIFRAFLPEKAVQIISKICRRSIDCFGKFLVGQGTEAIILGTMCGVGMAIFGFPNALIISILVACTALIPIVGAFLGFAVGFLLICADSFSLAVWYLVFMTIIQQIEGNLIYPKVVGGSVGLPSLWTLFAITVGGNMFGIMGMFLSVPAFSVIYATLSEIVAYRNEKKNLSKTKKECRQADDTLNE